MVAKQRTHSTERKRRVVQEYLAGDTLHELARRHNLPRNLIRIWVDGHLVPGESGNLGRIAALDDIAALAHTIDECEIRIEAIERLVASRASEFGTPGKTRPQGQEPGDASAPDVTGPPDPPPPEDSG